MPGHATPSEFFTVGHSNLGIEDFLDMLGSAGVGLVVDVRRLPASKKFPWFDRESLGPALEGAGIDYCHAPALTGRRPEQPDVPDEVNGFWENRSFHNYADHALSEEFQQGLAQLRNRATQRPALLCAEAVWWRCHRRLIADHLLARGERVSHLMGPGKVAEATLTRGAVVGEDMLVRYPANH